MSAADASTSIVEEGGKEVKKGAHSDKVFSISFSPNFDIAVTASMDNTAIVWEGERGGKGWKVANKARHPDSVRSAMFHPTLCEGLLFATSCDDGGVRLWRAVVHLADGRNEEKGWEVAGVKGGDASLTFNPSCGGGKALAFSRCGSNLAVSFNDNYTVCLYSVRKVCDEGGEEESRVGEEKEGWPCITLVAKLEQAHYYAWLARPAFSSLTPHLLCMCTISGRNNKEVKVWKEEVVGREGKEESWTSVSTLSTPSTVTRLAFASSSPSFCLMSSPFNAMQWSGGGRRPRKEIGKGKTGEEKAVESSRAMRQENVRLDVLAAGCDNGSVVMWAVDTASSPPTFSSARTLSKVHTASVFGLSFAMSDKGNAAVLISGDNKGQIFVWRGPPPSSLSLSSPPIFTRVQSVSMGGAHLHDCAISPFGRTMGAVQWDGAKEVQFWPCHSLGMNR